MPFATQTPDERHLLIRVRLVDGEQPSTPADALPSRLTVEVEAQVDHASIYPAGRVDLNIGALRRLEGEKDNKYGRQLAQCLTASLPLQGALAALSRSAYVRVQLMLEPAGYPLSLLRWERLQFSQLSDAPIGRSDRTPFSRFASVNREEVAPQADTDLHLLVVVANPSGTEGLATISASGEVAALINACEGLLKNKWIRLSVLPGEQGLDATTLRRCQDLGIPVVAGPATKDSVAQSLANAAEGIDGLHIVAHGSFNSGSFHLFLENEEGDLDPVASEDLLNSWALDGVRLIYLQSCQSAIGGKPVANDPRPHITGFMQDLVDRGVPGVVAMQDFIRTDDGAKFCETFYSSLVSDGCADRAANAGRLRIPDDDGTARWSIPAFATRLANAAVWTQSDRRFAQEKLRQRIKATWSARGFKPLPLDVVAIPQSSLVKTTPKGADEFATLTIPSTSKTNAAEALEASLETDAAVFTAVIGKRGRGKTQLLENLFLTASQNELQAPDGRSRICLMLRLPDLAHRAYDAGVAIARAVASHYEELTGTTLDAQLLADEFEKRPFAFLIHGDTSFGPVVLEGLRVLEAFAGKDRKSPHRFVLTLDENRLFVRDLPDETQCLVVQPMRPERVRQFLMDGTEANSPERRLLGELKKNALFDLAEVPWLLNEMLGLARRGNLKPSRAKIIGRIISDDINRYKGSASSAVRLRGTLQRFAWEALTRRDFFLPGSEAFDILQKLRGNRDYPLSNFLSDIIDSCNVLAYIGDDGIGFNYPGFRAYCAAEYLYNLPDAQRSLHLEDITAQLGRQSRADLWRDTLYILAGLWDDTTKLISMILSGSLLYQGDQLFIAVRCLQEARLSFNDMPGSDSPIVQSIVGSLLQQTSPVGLRSVSGRTKAIEHLGPLREQSALRPLISLVVDRVRPGRDQVMYFDYSAVRLAAMKALRYMDKETTEEIARDSRWSNVQGLSETIDACLKNDCGALRNLLRQEKDPVSAIAALALGLSLDSSAYDALTEAFLRKDISVDTRWAITDALIELADSKLSEFVRSCIESRNGNDEMLAHIIGKLGQATKGSIEWQFLEANVNHGDDRLAGRSLQALAELSSNDIIPTCHRWLTDQSSHLPYFALQALRLVGQRESLQIIENLRWDPTRTDMTRMIFLDSVRLEVYEGIYWRLVGGLSRETMAFVEDNDPKSRTQKAGGAA